MGTGASVAQVPKPRPASVVEVPEPGCRLATEPPHRVVVNVGAGDGTRTRDILLGRQTLYQLSYPRADPCSRI